MDSNYIEIGNYNYGMLGTAIGIPEEILLRAAGFAQLDAGTSRPEWGHYLDLSHESSYGDDPEDQALIKEGIDLYYEARAGEEIPMSPTLQGIVSLIDAAEKAYKKIMDKDPS